MAEWIVSSSVLICAVLFIRRITRGHMSSRLQYALWAVVLVRLLLPVPIVRSSISVMSHVESSQIYRSAVSAADTVQVPSGVLRDSALTFEEAEQNGPGTLHRVEGYPQQSSKSDKHTYTYKDSLGVVAGQALTRAYFIGIAVVGAWFLYVNARMYLRIRRSRSLIRVIEKRPVYLCKAIDAPCLFGLVHPAIYVTDEVLGDENMLRHAAAHELTHFRHGDHIWSALRGVCLVLHWYNPLVWIAAFLSRDDAEVCCDESAILRIGEIERAAYGRTLIKLTCGRQVGLLNASTTMHNGRSIKRRIEMIVKKPKTAAAALVVAILAIAAVAACTFTGAVEKFGTWNKTSGMSGEDILSAVPWNESGNLAPLSAAEREELAALLAALDDEDFAENKHLTGSTATYGLIVETADGKFSIIESISPGGSLETNFGGKQWWIDDTALSEFIVRVTSSETTAISFAEFATSLPVRYMDKLIVASSPDTGVLLTVRERKSVEEYMADRGKDNGRIGTLFSIVCMDAEDYERHLMSDTGGISAFARNDGVFYCIKTPTDVSIYRTYPISDADMEQWENLRGLSHSICQEMIASGIEKYDGSTARTNFTYPGEHRYFKCRPYASVNGSADEEYILVLSQPVTQGGGGIWCVERMTDKNGAVYLYFPNTDVSSEEYYAKIQADCDAGIDTAWLDPAFAAEIFYKTSGYFSSRLTEGTLLPCDENGNLF